MFMCKCSRAEISGRMVDTSNIESSCGKVQARVKYIQTWDDILGFATPVIANRKITCVLYLAKFWGLRVREHVIRSNKCWSLIKTNLVFFLTFEVPVRTSP